MTYPVPSFSTIAGAQAVGGVDLNRLVDAVNDLNTRMVNTNGRIRLRRVANQSITSGGSAQAISWDTEDLDNGGFITVTATTITIPTGLDGTYGITFRAVGLIGAGRAFGELNVTSAITGIGTDYRQPMIASEQRVVSPVIIPLLAGDSFVCNVFHSTGSSVNFTGMLNCIRLGA